MAQKEWKKYKERRLQSERTARDIRKAMKSSVAKSKRKKAARERKEREFKRKLAAFEKENDKWRAEQQAKAPIEPLTQEEAVYGGWFLFVIVAFIFVAFNHGFKAAFIVSLGIILVSFIIYFIKNGNVENEEPQEEVPKVDLDELGRMADNFKVYQNVIKTSKDSYAIKCASDEMLSLIESIEQYEDSDLRTVGITKWHLNQAKKKILDSQMNVANENAENK